LRPSLQLDDEATAVETALAETIAAGARTPDIAASGETAISTDAMTAEILRHLG